MFCNRGAESAEISRWLLADHHYEWIVMGMPALLVLMGLLMISSVPYPHAVYALSKGRHSMPFLVGAVLVVAVAAIDWPAAIAVLTTGYVAWGMLVGLFRAVFGGPRSGGGVDVEVDVDEDYELSPRREPSRN